MKFKRYSLLPALLLFILASVLVGLSLRGSQVTIDGSGLNASQRALLLRQTLSAATPGMLVNVGPGNYALGNQILQFPDGVVVRGAARETTILTSNYANGEGLPGSGDPSLINCGYELGNGSVLEDMTFETLGPVQQAETIGWSGGVAALRGNSSATIRRCVIRGLNWPVYSWSGIGNSLTIEDTDIYGGRTLVASCNSGSPTGGGFIDLYRCPLHGDSSLVTYTGGMGQFLQAIINRGGRCRAFNCPIDLVGDKTIAMVQAAWVGSATHNINGTVELHQCTVRINPNGAAAWCDVNQASGNVKYFGGSGSNPDGTFRSYTGAATIERD